MKTPLEIHDHAIVRYLEIYHKLDVKALKKQMFEKFPIYKEDLESPNQRFEFWNATAVVKRGKVYTYVRKGFRRIVKERDYTGNGDVTKQK